MLVSEFYEGTVSNKPYKYQTKVNMVRCLKRLGLWDLEYAEITPNLCWERIDSHFNMNVKRVYAGYVRNIFDFDRKQIPIIEGQARNYDLPSQQELHDVIERSKYRFHLYLMMYGGLRVGEACAVVPEQVQRINDQFWLYVDRAFSQDGKSLSSPKTLGRVIIPDWLAKEILEMKDQDRWQLGTPTKRITEACYSLSAHGAKTHINPHMLRHWFATDMVRRNVPIRIIADQLRHKNINTTMRVYTQVKSGEYDCAIPQRPISSTTAEIIQFRLA
jgi:integrase